jgi:hypothetical protein
MLRALVMLAVDASKAVVIPPAADWTEIPVATTWLTSLFLTSKSWAEGDGLAPSVRVISTSPVPAAAVATVNLSAEFKVKPMSPEEVEIVLPPL